MAAMAGAMILVVSGLLLLLMLGGEDDGDSSQDPRPQVAAKGPVRRPRVVTPTPRTRPRPTVGTSPRKPPTPPDDADVSAEPVDTVDVEDTTGIPLEPGPVVTEPSDDVSLPDFGGGSDPELPDFGGEDGGGEMTLPDFGGTETEPGDMGLPDFGGGTDPDGAPGTATNPGTGPDPDENPFETGDPPPDAPTFSVPEPDVTPPAKPADPLLKPSPADAAAVAAAMNTAREALATFDFSKAEAELAKAEQLPKGSEDQAKLARLQMLAGYAKDFRSALVEALNSLQATDEIEVGTSTVVAVVSASSDKISIRTAGITKSYAIDDLPPGLAVAIANKWLDPQNPVNLVIKGAYVASLNETRADRIAKVREWWQEAVGKGVNIGDLEQVLEDKYGP
jgi:hypothetical protein